MNPEAAEALRQIIAAVPVVYVGTAPLTCMHAGIAHGRFWFVDTNEKMHVAPATEPVLIYGGKHVRIGDLHVLPLRDADDVENDEALESWNPGYYSEEPGKSFIEKQLEIIGRTGSL